MKIFRFLLSFFFPTKTQKCLFLGMKHNKNYCILWKFRRFFYKKIYIAHPLLHVTKWAKDRFFKTLNFKRNWIFAHMVLSYTLNILKVKKIVDSHAVVKDNTKRACVPFTQLPSNSLKLLYDNTDKILASIQSKQNFSITLSITNVALQLATPISVLPHFFLNWW